jgi:hypothetical protein
MTDHIDRCPTTSGRYRCTANAGHEGPCETVEPAAPWVGPALRPPGRGRRYIGKDSTLLESTNAATTLTEDASSRSPTTIGPLGGSTRQGGA